MKSPSYVYGTVKLYRELIDSRRAPTPDERRELEELFSRSGFTDGYFTRRLGKKMFGVRREEDKESSRAVSSSAIPEPPRTKLEMELCEENGRATLTASALGKSYSVERESVNAEGAGTDEATLKDALSKLGQTPFAAESIKVTLSRPVFFPRSVINAMRREVCEGLESALIGERACVTPLPLARPVDIPLPFSGYFVAFAAGRVPSASELEYILSKKEISAVFLPLFSKLQTSHDVRLGVYLPRAVFDTEKEEYLSALDNALRLGYKNALAENLGVARLAMASGMSVVAGAGLNATNAHTLEVLRRFGFSSSLLSCEMTEAMKRDVKKPLPTVERVWGRAPLMLIENCVMGVEDGCRGSCRHSHCTKTGVLTDRKGESMPVIPDAFHRSVVYNSRPTNLADLPVSRGVFARLITVTAADTDVCSIIDRVIAKDAPDTSFTRK